MGGETAFGRLSTGWASKQEDLRGLHLMRRRLEVGGFRIANPRFRKAYFSVAGGQLHPEFQAVHKDDWPQAIGDRVLRIIWE